MMQDTLQQEIRGHLLQLPKLSTERACVVLLADYNKVSYLNWGIKGPLKEYSSKLKLLQYFKCDTPIINVHVLVGLIPRTDTVPIFSS